MIVILLIVIICILLFGGAAVLGVLGITLGGIAAVILVAYVGVHYEIDHDLVFPGFIGLCLVVVLVAILFKFKEHLDRRRQEAKRLEDQAANWERVVSSSGYDNLTPELYEMFVRRHPEYQAYYEAWLKLGRKDAKA